MFELKQLNIIKFCLSNGKFRGSKTKYDIANYFPDGVTGKFVISGRYCCVPDVNIHLIKPHLKFSLHLFYRRTYIFKYFIHQHDNLHLYYREIFLTKSILFQTWAFTLKSRSSVKLLFWNVEARGRHKAGWHDTALTSPMQPGWVLQFVWATGLSFAVCQPNLKRCSTIL